jgi:subtilisin-like proprotein convertase family protein
MSKHHHYCIAFLLLIFSITTKAQECAGVSGELSITGYSTIDAEYFQVCQGDTVEFSLSNAILPEGESNYVYSWTIGGLIIFTDTPNLEYIANQGGVVNVSLSVSLPFLCESTFQLSNALSTVAYPIITTPIETGGCINGELILEGSYIQPSLSGNALTSNNGGWLQDFSEQIFTLDVLTALPGSTIEDCSQFVSVNMNAEHSYMGDQIVTITCPNGTSVVLHQQGGGNTFWGEALDDMSGTPGIGYDYSWSASSALGTMAENGVGGILPSDTYQPVGDLCDLVGCPANGTWTISFADVFAADDGQLFSWGITLDQSLFLTVGEYTPTIDAGPTDTYWYATGNGFADENLDLLFANTNAIGTTEYTYHVENSAGCVTEQVIEVEIQSPAEDIVVDAGYDFVADNVFFQLDGDVSTTAQCGDPIQFEYCLRNNSDFSVTYNPSIYFNCNQPITLTVISGTLETNFDFLTVYNGPSTDDVIFGSFDGNFSGLFFTSTHPTGAITIQFTTDGSISCSDGNQPPVVLQIATSGESQIIYSWSPSTGLTDTEVLNPGVVEPSPVQYVLSAYSATSPYCVVTDTVNVYTDSFEFLSFVFNDLNGNGIKETNEPGIGNIEIVSENMLVYSTNSGEIDIPIVYGDNEVEVLYDPAIWQPTTPTSQTFTADATMTAYNGDYFGLQSISNVNAGSVSLFQGQPVCGQSEVLFVNYTNTGSTAFSGQIEVTIDPLVSVIGGDPFPSSIDGNVLTFNVSNLAPGEEGVITMTYVNPTIDGFAPFFTFSTVFISNGNILDQTSFTNQLSCTETMTHLQEETGLGELGLVLPESTLEYTLNFDYTLLGPAGLCTVQLPLSEHIDINTIQVAANTPIYSTYILSDNTLQVHVPYQSLEYDNNTVQVSAQLLPSAVPGTLIEHNYTVLYDDYATTTSNLESNLVMDCETQPVIIYQDANNPAYYYTNVTGADITWYNNGEIIAENVPYVYVNFSGNLTATANINGACEMISAPVIVTNVDEIKVGSSISLFPNPTSNSFSWNSKENITAIEVYNSLGQRIFQNTNILTNHVSTSEWAVGTYHVVMETTSGQRFHQSLVVSR